MFGLWFYILASKMFKEFQGTVSQRFSASILFMIRPSVGSALCIIPLSCGVHNTARSKENKISQKLVLMINRLNNFKNSVPICRDIRIFRIQLHARCIFHCGVSSALCIIPLSCCVHNTARSKENKISQKLVQCVSHHRVRLQGVHHTAESDSVVCITLQSQVIKSFRRTLRCVSHCWVRLHGVHHTVESDSLVWIITLSQILWCASHCGVNCTLRRQNRKMLLVSGCFLRDSQTKSFYRWSRLSWWTDMTQWNLNWFQNYFSLFIGGLDEPELWKKFISKISWHTFFKLFYLLSMKNLLIFLSNLWRIVFFFLLICMDIARIWFGY